MLNTYPHISLPKLIADFADYQGHSVMIKGLCLDSRIAKPGDLFLANKGVQQDGRLFIEQAIKKGVAAVLYEAGDLMPVMQQMIARYQQQLPIIPIAHLDQKIGLLAAAFYQHPAKDMHITGITGTNGKTSCAYFLTQSLELLHKKAAMMGTIGVGTLNAMQESTHTTLEPISLQQHLQQFAQQHIKYVNMEVSSHGLSQYRVIGVPFEVAVFTNLTLDHLDYHHTMQAYGAAKARLFQYDTLKHAVINLDDAFAIELINTISDRIQITGVSLTGKTHARCNRLISAQDIVLTKEATQAHIQVNGTQSVLKTPILGAFNVSNLLLVLGVLLALDISLDDGLSVLPQLKEPIGRLSKIGGVGKVTLIVDYAHTPDALEQVLSVLKPLCLGQLWCVFGCGGDRDNSKRPKMAEIAQRYADHIIVTDDNPRTEDAQHIVAQILQGFKTLEGVLVEHDRKKAIDQAVKQAKPEDIVLIAGKGHETYQIIGTQKHHFSDLAVAQDALSNS